MIDLYGIFLTDMYLSWENDYVFGPKRSYSVYKLMRRSDQNLIWGYIESFSTIEQANTKFPSASLIEGVRDFRGSFIYEEGQL